MRTDTSAALDSLRAAIEKAGYSIGELPADGEDDPAGRSLRHCLRVATRAGQVAVGVRSHDPLVLPMFDGLGAHWMLSWLTWRWLLATPVQFWLGARFYRAG